MGRRFEEVQEEIRRAPFAVVGRRATTCAWRSAASMYSPPEISAAVLQKMKKTAEDYLGETVTEAVITVPAYFNDAQRQATKDAGRIAGLEVKRIVNEPTAAALAYGLDKNGREETIAVYDLGGGTFDISILELGDGVFEVKSTNGDTHLGGDDFDQRIIDWMAGEFRKETGIDLSRDRMALQRLKEAAEKAKIELSSAQATSVNLPFITADQAGPRHLSYTLTRAKLEQLLAGDLFERTRGPCVQAHARRGPVPGGHRPRDPRRRLHADPRRAGHREGDLRQGGQQGGQSRRGRRGRRRDPGRDPRRGGEGRPAPGRHPACPWASRPSAACSPGSSTGTRPSPRARARPSPPPPTARPRCPSTCCRASGRWRRRTGRWDASTWWASRRPPRGVPQIEVTFDIDANGIVHVSAKDLGTGKEQKIRIESSSGLAEDEIKRMVQRRRGARGGGQGREGEGRGQQRRREPHLRHGEIPRATSGTRWARTRRPPSHPPSPSCGLPWSRMTRA